MANSLYDVLNKNLTEYDPKVLDELLALKNIISEEKEEFKKGIELTQKYIQKQNKENMELVNKLCKDTEQDMIEKCRQNPILSFF